MQSNNTAHAASTKISWDISPDDSSRVVSRAIMWNDNGVWFEYAKEISINRIKTVMRQLSRSVPIQTVKVRPLDEVGADNCEYRCFYCNGGLLVSKQEPDDMNLAYRSLTDKELASLFGKPSLLIADYWDELYSSCNEYCLSLNWADGNEERELDKESLGRIAKLLATGERAGYIELPDVSAGVLRRCKWELSPAIESVVRRALWLGKGNTPAAGC